jgi:trimeric autotransporter adhesin
MRHTLNAVRAGVLIVLFCSLAGAQSTNSTPSAVVPQLVNFSGKAVDAQGKTISGVAGVTFAIYTEQSGGSPLWLETQSIQADAKGNYTAQLGATKAEGLPLALFTSGEARWLGVTVNGGQEQPRVLLLSVPYALKAADAQTLGGLPASAFMLAAPPVSLAPAVSAASADGGSVSPSTAADVTTTGGSANFLPFFNGASTIIDSVVEQTGSGSAARIGIGTSTPAATLDVKGSTTVRGLLNLPATSTATASAGSNSNGLGLVASTFNSGTKAAANQVFHWFAEPVGNNTSSPSATLNLLFATAPNLPAETGLHISSSGQITFAAGQTFPGTGPGTITGLTAGTALTGGGTSGSVTLNLDTTKVPLLASANTFTGNNNFNGGLSATSNLNTIVATTSGPGDAGVSGIATATSGGSNGVYGTTQDAAGAGVLGVNESTLPGGAWTGGVVGISTEPSVFGSGVLGEASGGAGVTGMATGYGAVGLKALGFNQASGSDLNGGAGAVVHGGNGDPNDSTEGGTGIVVGGGDGGKTGASGIETTGGNAADAGDGIDAYGGAGETGGGDGRGGYFLGGQGHAYGDGIYAESGSGSEYAWAGDFNGDVNIAGTLSGGSASSKIDDPLDAANKYLYHSFVESSDMMNIYNGNATTDSSGLATITLPDWFETLNRDFRYQLTVIGQFAQAIVAKKVENNQFQIRTSLPNVEVSWQVTGIRQDAWANAHRVPVEEEKEARLKGYYIHPELYGAPPEKQIEWARHPGTMNRMQQHRQQMNAKQAQTMTQSAALPHNSTK